MARPRPHDSGGGEQGAAGGSDLSRPGPAVLALYSETLNRRKGGKRRGDRSPKERGDQDLSVTQGAGHRETEQEIELTPPVQDRELEPETSGPHLRTSVCCGTSLSGQQRRDRA